MMQHDSFEQKVKASLDRNLQQLDFDTRQQLASRRQQASEKSTNKWLQASYWLPAGSLALCSLFAAIMLFNPNNSDKTSNQDQIVVFELLDNAEELDVITDPDFYAWIDETLAEDEKIAS